MKCPDAVIFDLDDTLAESFRAPSPETLAGLSQILERMHAAIMTGASFRRMEEQFLPDLAQAPRIDRFYLFPTSASHCLRFSEGLWKELYAVNLSPEDRERIRAAIKEVVGRAPPLRGIRHYGERLIDREAQIAFTLVGIEAPQEVKQTWDADGSRRRLLRDLLAEALPDFEVLLGGTTTVDITTKGINKAYGVRWLSRELGIAPERMLFVGDALFPGGNDMVVKETGIRTREVSGPAETLEIIREIIAGCPARA